MAIFKNGHEIKHVYKGGLEILNIYHGGRQVFKSGPILLYDAGSTYYSMPMSTGWDWYITIPQVTTSMFEVGDTIMVDFDWIPTVEIPEGVMPGLNIALSFNGSNNKRSITMSTWDGVKRHASFSTPILVTDKEINRTMYIVYNPNAYNGRAYNLKVYRIPK